MSKGKAPTSFFVFTRKGVRREEKKLKKMKKIFVWVLAAFVLGMNIGCDEDNGKKPPRIPPYSLIDSIHLSVDSIKPEEKRLPTVNVYIENSASMDGYVQGNADFKTDVYTYLQYIKIQNICDSLNMYYINSRMFAQGTIAGNTDVPQDFIYRINPTDFRLKGTVPGENSRGTTDIDNLFRSILDKTNEHTISILVTDGIFSPGRNRDAETYLAGQKVGLMGTFSTLMNKLDNAAVMLYQMFSQFDGYYYDKNDHPIQYRGVRPYYIWVIGNSDNLVNLRKAVSNNRLGDGVNMFMISEINDDIDYAIDVNFGRHQKDKSNDKHTISGLKKDKKGNVKFAINVDFNNRLIDNDYLLNSDNYIVDMGHYTLNVGKAANSKYTHRLEFTSKDGRPHPGKMHIKLKMIKPSWVEDSNDAEGEQPLDGKTYGIALQVDGIFSAFTKEMQEPFCYQEIEITIK